MTAPLVRVPCLRSGEGGAGPAARVLPEETAIALVFDGATQAVMMATPADLEDFAVGFALSEAIVAAPDEIRSCEIVAGELGIEAHTGAYQQAGAKSVERRHGDQANEQDKG